MTDHLPLHAGIYAGSTSEVEDSIARARLWTEDEADVLRVDGKHRRDARQVVSA